ncbi:type I polyketide synthase [Streptomyces sp. PSAA01]|uniref:type I polyketide synthase n=1 Tax=Streptomyces sp. PSAA01 TaxID=2912762 RepID=UPI001F30F53A|nr:type I polyketide synthase [Streptomyces sp. PSAA01]MCG0284472.1 acyltransferase domain-containing protein [Streptomyces sp. PSAA01]
MRSEDFGVAVIGMSCRFPGVAGLGEFWRLLLAGNSTVGRFPEQREVISNDASHPDAATVMSGSFFDTIDEFDAEFFGMGPAEAAATDPVQRLGLELAWEAVEDARIPATAVAGREIDVLVAAAPSGYDLLRRLSGSDRDDHYAALGASGGLIANRISGLLDLRGMSMCADSGQSSSLVSLALACDRIRSGAVDMALVGSVNLIVDPEAGLGLANLGALSPDGRCFTFDERASGFVRGEGGAFVLLKRYDLAVADGDRSYAVVRGWGVGSGGASSRMPDPSPAAQAATVLAALSRADVPFDDVDYVEAHGTGTRVGDPAEIAGLREVFRETGRRRPLLIGSVKTNVGHLEPAAGVVGFVKAALCVDRAHLVPSLNYRSPSPAIPDFEEDFEVLTAARPWPRVSGRPRRAGVSAFGLGGTNAHVILERICDDRAGPGAVAAERVSGGVGGVVPWVLTARSEPALRDQAARLRDLVAADASLPMADVGHSLLATRASFEHRAVVLGGDRAQALAGLDVVAAGGDSPHVVRGVAARQVGPVVFVFPGHGSQWAGMGRQLYAESEVFARGIDECARALAPWVDWSLTDVVTGVESAVPLDRTDVVQPVMFAVMVSLARVWRSLGVFPDAVVGHSLGEIAAACVAGALSVEDAARIVALRGLALTELTGLGGMSAVSAPLEWVRNALGRWPGRLCVGAVNGPASVVVSGDLAALDEFAALAADDGVRVRRVRIDYASHSHQIERIRDRMLKASAGATPRKSAVAFYSTVTGRRLDTHLLDGSYWYDNLRSTVRFGEVVEQLMRDHGGVFVEVSAHPVLAVALAETADALAASPVVAGTLHKDDGSVRKVLSSLAELHVRGVAADWAPVFGARPRRIDLPTYAFHRQPYWLAAPDDAEVTIASSGPASIAAGRQRPLPAGSAVTEPRSQSAVLALVCAETAAVLRTGDADSTSADLAAPANVTFKDLGLDSSKAVLLRNRLAAAAGVRLPAIVAFSHPTPEALSRHIFSLLAPPASAQPETAAGSDPDDRGDDELYALIDSGYQ